ncbi:hypothetical protein BJV82DRAFT_662071 [Fennellomyces sp. T-0311]|nr:hypothetical protein BJV82DRAFT_662071 [Fennellomyces sp. T-0311]
MTTARTPGKAAAIAQIKVTTSDIDNILKRYIILLDARASAYGTVGDFANGMRDAEQMVQYAPTLAGGYTQMGELYSLLGYHLPRCNNATTQQRSKSDSRADIIGRARYDIVSSILKHLEPYERIKLLGVPRKWQWQLLAGFSLWSTSASTITAA